MNRTLLEDRRVWIGGGVLIAILLVAATWLMLVGPKFDSASSLQSENEDALGSNQQLQVKNNKLAAQAENLSSLQARLRTALDGLPGEPEFDGFTEEVTSLAKRNDVLLTNITLSAPTQAAAAVAPTTEEGASAAPAAPTAPTAAASSVSSIAVTLSSAGPGSKQNAFLEDLQNGARRALVMSSQLSVGGSSRVNSLDSETTMTTQLTIFTAPMTTDQLRVIQRDLAAR